MLDAIRTLDRRVVTASADVRILSRIAWPEGTVQAFLAGCRGGQPRYPEAAPPTDDLTDAEAELLAIERDAEGDHPMLAFIRRTARSYVVAARLLAGVRTPAFVEHSCALYGGPTDRVAGAARTHLDAARALLAATAPLKSAGLLPDDAYCVTAEAVRSDLARAFAAFFGEAAPVVVVDPHVAAKAAAGPSRVRLRAATCYTDLDARQLIEHEGFVHAGTALNGGAQPYLTCMGQSVPRTTATQEGLATFAELITQSMDISRLRRLALRTVAIHHALEDADVVEVYRFFRDEGYSEDEAAHAALRVFRGGTGAGGVAFTKDVVYVSGLVAVHAFLHTAVAEGRAERIPRLFAGRLTLDDVEELAPAFDQGHVTPGRFIAPWAQQLPQLAAFLAFTQVAQWMDGDRARAFTPRG